MIKQIRVDYRLLHGQVAVSWTSALGADCLLLVSDTVKSDPLRLETLKLAKPAGTKVVVKNQQEAIDALNSGVTDKYKLFIICENLENAKAILEATGEKSLNVGNTPFRDNTKQYGKSANLTKDEEELIKDMLNEGASIIAYTYFGSEKVVEGYNIMGVAKAALEASVRYLSVDLGKIGCRINAISAGPIKTLSAKGIKDFGTILDVVEKSAPLHRNVTTKEVGDVTAFLFSDLSSAITGEIIHVDNGFSSVGV